MQVLFKFNRNFYKLLLILFIFFVYCKNGFIWFFRRMDCGSFCISWILSKINHDFKQSDFIFSEIFPGVSLLPKIGILLLDCFSNVEIVHVNQEIFINLKNEELLLLEEYAHWLDGFQELGGIYFNHEIDLKFLKENLKDNYCIIPIKKGEGSHFVILDSIVENKVNLVDNKKGEFSVSITEFEKLIDLENGKYVLFVTK